MSCITRLQIGKVDRRCESRCADTIAKHRGDKVVTAKLDRTSMKNFEDSSPGAGMEKLKLTTALRFGQWPHKKVNTVSQIGITNWGMPCLTRKLVFANVKSRQEV